MAVEESYLVAEAIEATEEGVPMSVYQFIVVIEPDEDAFHAYVPALPGCHTFGATVEETRVSIAEAIALHVESMLEDGEPIPSLIKKHSA